MLPYGTYGCSRIQTRLFRKHHGFLGLLCLPFFVVIGSLLPITAFSIATPFISILLFALFNWWLHVTTNTYLIFFSVIVYSIACTIANLIFTGFLAFSGWQYHTLQSNFWIHLVLSVISHGFPLLSIFIFNRSRKAHHTKTLNWNWYSIPAALSALCLIMEFYLNLCFRQGQIDSLPLSVCVAFIAVFNIASLLLVNWIEQTAHLREETFFLHAQIKAQSEGIEALSPTTQINARFSRASGSIGFLTGKPMLSGGI